MKKISILIPTYNSPHSLDLLIHSLLEGAHSIENIEILVGVDGTQEKNQWVIDKYKGNSTVKWLLLEENVGLATNTNLLVYNAINELVLILNDDNVAPRNFDYHLLQDWSENIVLTPNQIEPFPSIFPQFNIMNLGRDPKTFNLENFQDYAQAIHQPYIDNTGSTLPIFMSKQDYLRVGGWDPQYGKRGLVTDWDFFLKCTLSGMVMKRTYGTHFYHFVSLTGISPQQKADRRFEEGDAHEFSKYKWGSYIKNNPVNNLKYL